MLLSFTCRHCQARLEVEGKEAGLSVPCPRCGQSNTVPNRFVGPGVTVGDFRLKKQIARGGMGEVYLATQLSMDREVAVKILPAQLTLRPGLLERFQREVKLAARLEHDHIVPAFAAGEDEGIYYMAMAYIEGETLDRILSRSGPIPEAEALMVIRSIAQALGYAWEEERLLHRDIKPGNIMIDRNGSPRLLDLGLSKSLDDEQSLTRSRMIMGTPNYVSPEQAEGSQQLDCRSDIYSLGATLHHMLTGELPFKGSDITETLQRQQTEHLPDVRTRVPGINLECALLVQKMLSKDRAGRPQSWVEVLNAIDLIMADNAAGGREHRASSVVAMVNQGERKASSAEAAKASESSRRSSIWKRSRSRIPPWLPAAAGALIAVGLTALMLPLFKGLPPAPTPTPREPRPAAPASKPTAQPANPKPAPTPTPAPAPKPSVPVPEAAPQATEPSPAMVKAAREKLDALYREVAAHLSRLEVAEAGARVRDTLAQADMEPVARELESLKQWLALISDLPRRVMEGFKPDLNNTLRIELTTGTETLRIRDISNNTLTAEKVILIGGEEAGSSAKNITFPMLSTRERYNRLGTENTPELNFLRAMLAISYKNRTVARDLLARIDDPLATSLGEILQEADERAEASRQAPPEDARDTLETLARKELEDILGLINLRLASDPELLAGRIRARRYGLPEVYTIRPRMMDYRRRFAGTAFAGEYDRIVQLLSSIAPNLPLLVTEHQVRSVIDKLRRSANQPMQLRANYRILDYGVELDLSNNPGLRDLSPLAELPLVSLDLSHTSVSSLSPLENLPLRRLRLNNSRVSDLKALPGMPLEVLSLAGLNELRELRSIDALSLTELDLYDNPVVDLTPISRMPLKILAINNPDIRSLNPLTDMTTLERLDAPPAVIWRLFAGDYLMESMHKGQISASETALGLLRRKWAQVPAAEAWLAEAESMLQREVHAMDALRNNPAAIPPQAMEFRGHHYLLYLAPMEWEEAQKTALGMGARLVVVEDEEENKFLARDVMRKSTRAWLGGMRSNQHGRWIWVTNENIGYSNWVPERPRMNKHHTRLLMLPGGGWLDVPDGPQAFILEWEPR